MNETNEILDNVLVLKVGTSTLTREEYDGRIVLDTESFERIGRQVLQLQEGGEHVVIVTSGGIAAGMAAKDLTIRPDKNAQMPELQYLASIGWLPLVNAWQGALPGRNVSPMLFTRHELDDEPTERDEALRVIYRTLRHRDLPVINENDSIAHEEIAFGDNDMLSAVIANQIARSAFFGSNVRLVLLSDVDGVYADKNDPDTVIPEIHDIEAYRYLAGGVGSANGTGGMKAKFAAAERALRAGVETWITHGRAEDSISRAINGEIGTHFRQMAYAS